MDLLLLLLLLLLLFSYDTEDAEGDISDHHCMCITTKESYRIKVNHCNNVYVVVQFYPWFKFYLLLYLGMVMSDTEFQTKESKILTKDKIEPQHYR